MVLVILQIIGLQSRIIKVFLDPKTNNLLMRVRKILESKYHFSYILLSFSIKHKSTPVSKIIIIKMDRVSFFFWKITSFIYFETTFVSIQLHRIYNYSHIHIICGYIWFMRFRYKQNIVLKYNWYLISKQFLRR